jgi:four helix bundle protein
MASNFEFGEIFKLRTKKFAVDLIKFCRQIPRNDEGFIVKKQLIRSVTSVAANYRAACRGRSNAEFYSKICICVEEADETVFWLEILEEAEILTVSLDEYKKEANEILAILAKTKSNSQKKII